jgi:crotonobetainyl-CoA:carnitine CoA-transferase CaiB-like acyl-CoA transferase
VRPPVKFSATPASVRSDAPRLGEHTEDVLREAGLDRDEIAELRALHVIA